MKQNIKNNLFRFVTLRNPQLIDKKEEKPGFVFHPDETSGVFFTALQGVLPENRQSTLQQTSTSFSALKTRTEARLINEELYLFSSWLMRNKKALSYVEIKNNTTGVTALTSAQEESIWDNLIYQTIEKKSTYVREAMIQLLVTNQFLNAFNDFAQGLSDDVVFTEDQEKEFIRRANASVVMSRLLFGDKTTVQDPRRKITPQQEQRALDLGEVVLAQNRIDDKKTLLSELKTVEVSYKRDNEAAYNVALNNHNAAVQLIMDNTQPVTVEETDPDTGEVTITTTYPEVNLPKFEFTPETPTTKAYLTGRLSTKSLQVYDAAGLEIYTNFLDVESAIKSSIELDYQLISKKTPKAAKKVKLGGAMLRAGDAGHDFDYNILPVSEIGPNGERNTYMLVYNYLQESAIESMTYTITFEDTSQVSGTDYFMTQGADGTFMLRFFPDLVPFPLGTESYTITGDITLQDGRILSFDQVVNFKTLSHFGMFTLGSSSETPDESTKTQLFGVTNLGIADFRRVEQEVCCYVPGEVSHIENVMAREYKERATRSLISSEVTTERSDERERENLTDATTTERSEMQSEVASVINSDETQSAGGGSNVSYSPKASGGVSINANAYFDSSSASSTSNSNSQAQTYAQEITERAMERIVQKTQTKRTSRILKEFEENNSHGFDNRKGSEHVTGVYRWVDKVYKNTLINYGKRLMYEFAIPEPSRFFKDAIYKLIEDKQPVESGVIIPDAPIHPRNLVNGISSADDINEDNYQRIAAEYNAEVNNPPIKEMSIGKSFSYTAPVTDKKSFGERNADHADVEIPEGYYTLRAKAKWYDSNDAYHNNSRVIVGAKLMPDNEVELDMDEFVGTIPVSFSQLGHLSGNANVSIRIKVLPETEEAWRNDTYNAILNAYYERLQEYNDAQDQDVIPTSDSEKLQFNPLYNRSLEKKELKRIAIELLTEPYNIDTSQDDYQTGAIPKVRRDSAFQNHASAVKFFEQAFDWDIMAYTFYPYFYANENDWKDLFQAQDAADPLFQAFLQSGMARTVIPVRPGFEDAVNWYMETGEIWNGQGLVVDQENDLYVSVAEEMQTIEGEVEGTWETRLPTALTVLQAGSIGLKVEGLPCDDDCIDFKQFDSDGNEILDENGESFSNPIKQTNAQIGGTDGVGNDIIEESNTVA